MRQFLSITINTFMELVRQPVFLLLLTVSSGFNVFLAAVPYFGFGDDPKLVKDSTLAVMLVSGLFGAVVSASASVAREIRQGTALAVLSKPIGRARFLLAKYVGLAATLTVLTYVNLISALLASRMAFDAYGGTDQAALAIFFGAVLLGYGVAGFSNYFLRRPFVSDAVLAVIALQTAAFVIAGLLLPKEAQWGVTPAVDWRLLPAGALILFALWLLAGLALACATRYEMIPSLAICTGVFLLGLMSDYLFGQRAEPAWLGNVESELSRPDRTPEQVRLLEQLLRDFDANHDGRVSPQEDAGIPVERKRALRQAGLGEAWWASVLYSALPNWQLFWLSDALEGKGVIPWGYVAKSFAYLAAYLGAVLVIALQLFDTRELS